VKLVFEKEISVSKQAVYQGLIYTYGVIRIKLGSVAQNLVRESVQLSNPSWKPWNC